MVDDSWVLATALAEGIDKPGVDAYKEAFASVLDKHFSEASPEERKLLDFGALTALRVWCASVGVAAASYSERHPDVPPHVALGRCVKVIGSWVPTVEIHLAERYVRRSDAD